MEYSLKLDPMGRSYMLKAIRTDYSFRVQKWEGPEPPTWFERLLHDDPFQTIRPIDITLMLNEELERFHENQCRLLFKR